MRIVCIGGGPAGAYFAILMKMANPQHDIVVYERNQARSTFGFGVVFSDQTLGNLETADPISFKSITEEFAHWDDIDVHIKSEVLTSTGHGFAGMGRVTLLNILHDRARDLGVELVFGREIKSIDEVGPADLIVCADGVNSIFRDQLKEHLKPDVDWRPNRFIWLGTAKEFGAFKFYFRQSEHGLFRVHAYRYSAGNSTFIVECTEDTWRRAGLDKTSEDESVAYCEALFKEELGGYSLLKNKSIWRQFPTINCGSWSHNNVVLLGDAVHTAHYSIGSGTKLAMEDAISLAESVKAGGSIPDALKRYEADRRPQSESVQRAAQVSLEWFEETERYYENLSPLQFTFSLLTRSLRITHSNLALRDPDFVERVDRDYAENAAKQSGVPLKKGPPTPPMFTPFKLGNLVLNNRVVVSPMSMYRAEDGTPGDFHLVHYGTLATGGAGLVMTEMTDVSREGRITPGCAGLYKPEHEDAWKRIVSYVHRESEAKIGIQLSHAGRKGATCRLWEGMDEPLPVDGSRGEKPWPLLSASPLPYKPKSQVPREMTRGDMDQVIQEFMASTRMAQRIGFDLLELHFAHGYLLASFLSPLTNQRKDEYGGSLENRLRFPLELLAAIRSIWKKPMSVRISATDWAPGGMDAQESVLIAQQLKAGGADIIDVSSGQTVTHARPRYGRLYQTPFADRIRLLADVPTITVGAVASFEDVNSVLAAGRADLVALARGHIYDPYFTRHAATKQGVEQIWPNAYISAKRYTPHF